MNKEVVKKWVAALRSGEYVQGRERLHRVVQGGEQWCCLGVLCDLAFKDGVVSSRLGGIDVDGNYANDGVYTYGLANHSSIPPDVVLEWLEASRDDSKMRDGSFVHTLVSMNDNHCCSKPFSEIADYIEEYAKEH